MLLIISPAKTLNFSKQTQTCLYTIPEHVQLSALLIDELRKLNMAELKELLKVNAGLARLNFERNLRWHLPFSVNNGKQALLTFNGEVFRGINAASYSVSDLKFAQDHLRILSGLHGVLRPLDLIQPYRLEMGIRLENSKGKNLYEFWDELITESINTQLVNISTQTLINLASAEYFKVLKYKQLKAEIITPEFLEFRNGSYKPITIYAKKARGLMTSFIIKNRLKDPEELKLFDWEGYSFNPLESEGNRWAFTR